MTEGYLYVPEMVVRCGGSARKVFKNRAQIRYFVTHNWHWFEDQCSFCSMKPGCYRDLSTSRIYSETFGDFKVNLCHKCGPEFPGFMEGAIEFYDELPEDESSEDESSDDC